MPALVRAASVGDASAIAAVYAPYVESSPVTFEELPPSAEDVRLRMLAEPRLPWLVAERDGAVVGYAYAAHHRPRPGYRWSVDVSVYLSDGEVGRGTGRLLYAVLLPVVTSLGYVNAYAGVALPNDASVGLHEAMGFRAVGVYRQVGHKQGRWIDVGWWHRQLRPPPDVPTEPVAWTP